MDTPANLRPRLKKMRKALDLMITCNTINASELKFMSEEEHIELTKLLKEKLDWVNRQHTKLLQIMGEVAQVPCNRLLWENNHLKITKAINTTLSATGQIPNHTYIAEITGLSRQTVAKHLSETEVTSIYDEQLINFSVMAPQVLNRVIEGAAAKHAKVPFIKLY